MSWVVPDGVARCAVGQVRNWSPWPRAGQPKDQPEVTSTCAGITDVVEVCAADRPISPRLEPTFHLRGSTSSTTGSCTHAPVRRACRPAPSGSARTSRRRRGCSHLARHLPNSVASSFIRPLRRPEGEALPSPHGHTAPRGAPAWSTRPSGGGVGGGDRPAAGRAAPKTGRGPPVATPVRHHRGAGHSASSGTCMTGCSSGWCRSALRHVQHEGPAGRPGDATGRSTRRSPRSAPRSPSCGSWPRHPAGRRRKHGEERVAGVDRVVVSVAGGPGPRFKQGDHLEPVGREGARRHQLPHQLRRRRQ